MRVYIRVCVCMCVRVCTNYAVIVVDAVRNDVILPCWMHSFASIIGLILLLFD